MASEQQTAKLKRERADCYSYWYNRMKEPRRLVHFQTGYCAATGMCHPNHAYTIMKYTPKYSESYGVAETARILHTDTSKVKTWAYVFREFMSKDAAPENEQARRFTREDIRVFAYVLQYWDDDPDIDDIRSGLSSNEHHEHEIIDQLLLQITPLFVEPPDDMDESWQHGVLHSGMAEVWDRFWLAESYMLAGHRLIDIALENEEAQRLFYPAIYNYRHALELYLKAVLEMQEQTHDLTWLYSKFEMMMKAKFNQTSPSWFANLIATFID